MASADKREGGENLPEAAAQKLFFVPKYSIQTLEKPIGYV